MIEAGTAMAVLQSALDRCRVDDIKTPEVYDALALLERHAAEKWPFNQFRSALDSQRSTPLEKEALWQILNASLNGIRRTVQL
jgi:hypothetical protein